MLRRIAQLGLQGPLDLSLFGLRARLHAANNVSEKRLLFTPQYFDPDEIEFLQDLAGSADQFVLVDIGANIGAYSLAALAAMNENGKILAVEPQPVIRDRLMTNIRLNDAEAPTVDLAFLAVGEENRTGSFVIDTDNLGQSRIAATVSSDHDNSLEVEMVTLLALLRGRGLDHVDLLKIDIEGSEDSVLVPFFKTAPSSLWPKSIIVERNNARWQTDCIELCQGLGYRRHRECKMNTILTLSVQPTG